MSPEHREKIRRANTGKVFSEERRRAIGDGRRGVKTPKLSGENNPMRKNGLAKRVADEREKRGRTARGPRSARWNPDRDAVARNVLTGRIARSFVNRTLKAFGRSWFRKTQAELFSVLGYDPEQLKRRIEEQFVPGMSWENRGVGIGKWQIDHIRPIASFPPDTPLSEVNALDNLRPVWQAENASKGSRWDG
jgi:hypothetical protein